MEAVCVLTNTIDKNIKGNIEFKEVSDYLVVTVNITGLSEGYHGIHIHQYGDLRDNCKSLCNHFNPYNKLHGDIGDSKNNRHVGDLGNIYADKEGNVRDEAEVQVRKRRYAVGRPRAGWGAVIQRERPAG